MTEKQILSTIKYVAGTKPVFLLSEIAVYLDAPQPVSQLYTVLRPHLKEFGLAAKKTGMDYEISRVVVPHPYKLSGNEEMRIERLPGENTFPPALEQAIEQYITRKVGKEWTDPVILERLRRAIVAQKDDYWKPANKRSLNYTKGYAVLGYLAYHFPVYFMQTRLLMGMLAREGLLKSHMTILDVGTGPGVVPLAIADFYSRLETATATIHAVERSEEHIEAYMYLTQQQNAPATRVTIEPPIKADITGDIHNQLPEEIDLMVFSNVLNELTGSIQERAEIVVGLAGRLAPDGSILIVEPAEEVTSSGLRSLSLALKKQGLSIYSPCSFIWKTNCTPDRCWSFVTAPSIRPTPLMNTLAACGESFRYVNTDIKYSYVILRRDGKIREPYCVPHGSRVLRLSRIHLHVEKRINIIASKMSGDLGDKENHMFKLCDGSAEKPVYAVLPVFHITPENEAILSAPYGSVLDLEGVLVRYNKEHDAYNVLISRSTRISDVHDQT
ncbi:MAG: small ribosomal subunit Rsm22 family protein [Methanoregula sp.]